MNRDNLYQVGLWVHKLVRIYLMIIGKTSQYFTLFFKRIAKHLTRGEAFFSTRSSQRLFAHDRENDAVQWICNKS